MLKLKIEQMTCNHCVSLINRAIKALDQNAAVEADITSHSVTINSSQSKEDILAALEDIGYPATSASSCCNVEMSCKSAKMAH
jgi:copper chaperone